ncbi:MAG: prepilin peptidase [Burkholderiaceae bacterium]|nr:prepilin peptidase [Burkholderiaceae bacterium]
MWVDFILRICLILTLLYLACVDFHRFLIPNRFTYPMIVFGLIFNSFSPLAWCDAYLAWLGAIFGYSLLWIINQLYKQIRSQHGLGMGDAKLLAALGAWLGIHSALWILALAALSGTIGGLLWLKYQKLPPSHPFPFGPFLAFAGIIQILWSSPLVHSLI